MSRTHRVNRIPLAGALVLAVSLVVTGCLGMGKNDGAVNAQFAVGGSANGRAAFAAGFFPWAKTNCGGCHGSSQHPLFAVNDEGAAYQYALGSQWIDFHDPINSLYALRAGDGHCGQSYCVGKTAQIEPLLQDWATAELTGGGGSGGGGGPTVPASIKFFSQGVAIPTPLPTGATFAVMRWQMNALSPSSSLMANSIFELEIQSLNANTYRIRNPKIVGLTQPVLLTGIHILIRKNTDPAPGSEDPLGDNWKNVGVNIQPRALPVPLPAGPIPNAPIIDTNAQGENVLSGSDIITLGFDDLQPGTLVPALPAIGTTATFTQVFGNIIVPKCARCHNVGNPPNGVSLANYTAILNQVQAGNPNGSTLYQAVTNGSPLMPKDSTPLNAQERAAISSWITAGAPNN